MFFAFINLGIVYLFLPLASRMILVLLTMFDRLTWLVYYIGFWVCLYLGYLANRA